MDVKKSLYILHRYKNFADPLPPLAINNVILAKVFETKFLGVLIEQHQQWHHHI